MRQAIHFMFVAAAVAGGAIAVADTASAACTRLAFSVNDYGKEGPTKDAKDLLDKYIAKSMAEKGVASYKTGKKDVNCELFLDFIVFDEYTCKAEATVCWDGSALPKSEQQAATPPAETKSPATKTSSAKTTTGSIDKPAAAMKADPVAESAPATVSPPAADASKAEATPSATTTPVQAAAPETPPASTEKRVEVYETLPPPASPSAPSTASEPADVVVAPSAPDRQAP